MEPTRLDDTFNDLTVRAMGPATAGGRMPLTELARVASGLQTTLERIGFAILHGQRRTGRMPQKIADAMRLDFVGFVQGSAVLQLERAGQQNTDDLLGQAFSALTDGLLSLQHDSMTLPPYFDLPTVNGLVTLCGGINSQNLTQIEFISGGVTHFALDADMRAALKSAQKRTSRQDITVVGRLHMGDFDPMALRCRIDTHAGSISCDLDDDLKDTVFELIDELVMASGVAEVQPGTSAVRVLHLSDIEQIESAESKSLDELAQEQNIRPIQSVDSLRGEDVEGFDEFLEIVRSAR